MTRQILSCSNWDSSHDIINKTEQFYINILSSKGPFTGTLFESFCCACCCCFLLPGEQVFPWRGRSQHTKLWHCCYWYKSRRELANLEVKKTAHSKTLYLQDPPWNILNQEEQFQLKFSPSSEPWSCKSVVSWVNLTGRKHGMASLL